MGHEFVIFNLAVGFVILAALIMLLILPCLLLSWKMLKEFWQWVKEKWSNISAWYQPIYIIASSIAFAIVFTITYHFVYSIFGGPSNMGHLHEEALSNIRRNTMLFIFAIIGICLAAWARLANEKQLRQTQQQLKYTGEQIENSIEVNRNDRFAKAAEMLSKKSEISSRGGLYILKDLIREDPKAEYIRCVEIISFWILEYKESPPNALLSNAIAKILKIRNDHEELENIIAKYKKYNNLRYWPTLNSVNLQDAFLWHANLRDAFLQNVKLQDADLKDANLQGADLKKANLRDANLRGANMQGADLRDANLQGTNLHGTNLQSASLQNANMRLVKLQNTNLKKANIEGADLTNSDMSKYKNLTKEQILSAKWVESFTNAEPPKLPDRLMKDSEVQEWLENPADEVKNYI